MIKRTSSAETDPASLASHEEFGKLVEKYQHLVTSVAYSNTGDFQRSEDIAQRTFLLAWQKQWHQGGRKMAAWLRQTAVNLSRNDNRLKINRSGTQLDPTQQADPASPDQAEQVLVKERQELLWATLERIPETNREVLILFYRQEKSVAEVAQLLDISVDTVKQRLSRGRKQVKMEMEQWVEDALWESRPSSHFSATILAALPSGTTAASTAAKAGASAFLTSIFSKVIGMIGIGGAVGVLGGLSGAGFGMLGAWFGVRQSLKHATSEEERILIQRFFRKIQIATPVFVVAMLLQVFGLGDSVLKTGMMITLVVLYTVGIAWVSVAFALQQRKLHEIHGYPLGMKFQKKSKPSTGPLPVNSLRIGTVGSLIGIWTWLIVLTSICQQWLFLVVVVSCFMVSCVSGCVFASAPNSLFQQARFQTRVIFGSGLLQFLTLLVAWPFLRGGKAAVPEWQESIFDLPGLLIGLFVLTFIGLLCYIRERQVAANELDNSK